MSLPDIQTSTLPYRRFVPKEHTLEDVCAYYQDVVMAGLAFQKALSESELSRQGDEATCRAWENLQGLLAGLAQIKVVKWQLVVKPKTPLEEKEAELTQVMEDIGLAKQMASEAVKKMVLSGLEPKKAALEAEILELRKGAA